MAAAEEALHTNSVASAMATGPLPSCQRGGGLNAGVQWVAIAAVARVMCGVVVEWSVSGVRCDGGHHAVLS